jgi:hypothetical protein
MHIPPRVSSDYSVRSIEGEKRLLSIINKYRVDYVIGSDFHGYARVKVGNTDYLITGGGGAHLKRRLYGHFHHGVVFHVGKDFISERILQVNADEDFEYQVRRYILAEIIPYLKRNLLLVIMGGTAIISGFLWSSRRLMSHFTSS